MANGSVKKRQALTFFVMCLAASIQAQDSSSVIHAPIVDARANEPIRIFSAWLPFRVAPINDRHEVTLNFHTGNTWNPSGVLEYPDASEPYPAKPWEATYHPPYSQTPQRYLLYSADGVLRRTTLSYTFRTSAEGEVFTTLTTGRLVGGSGFLDAAVADRSIEKLHGWLGQDDPFRRFENTLNATEFTITDRQGQTFRVKPNQLFPGTIDIGYRHFFQLVRNSRLLWSAAGTAQIGMPLARAREHLSAGALFATAVTQQLTQRYSTTLALAYSVQHDKVLRIRNERFDPEYASIITGYRFAWTQSIQLKKNVLYIGIEMQGMTAPLATNLRVVAPYLNPEDIGLQTNYKPEYWTTARPINITNQRRAARSLIRGSEYLTVSVSYRVGRHLRSPIMSLYIQEDWTVLYDTEGTRLPLFTISNNAQDLGAGIQLTCPLGVRRKI
jgi:hypothetical protein